MFGAREHPTNGMHAQAMGTCRRGGSRRERRRFRKWKRAPCILPTEVTSSRSCATSKSGSLRAKKLEQVDRAERLLTELDPARTYSYEYLCFRITDYRPDPSPQVVSGEEARHDVRLFVEDVSDAANLRVGELPEPVHTVEDLSRMFNVSTKTISRWRELGLVSRRFVFAGGKKRVGFLQSSVERFVSSHVDRVQRSERFSQLTSQERGQIIQRARRLACAGAGQAEVARRIAKRLNRSVEAIRYTLKLFDRSIRCWLCFPIAAVL